MKAWAGGPLWAEKHEAFLERASPKGTLRNKVAEPKLGEKLVF